MKLTFYRGDQPNFGDELNASLWDRLLGTEFFDDDEDELFVGIGSIIWNTFPPTARKIVMGSGYAGYTGAPDVRDGSWDIRFVRGPRTAQVLGLPREAAITDAAVLIRAVPLPAARGVGRVCFMPHHDSLERGHWREVCAMASIDLIDPTDPVDDVMARIRGARLLLTEAMHGAIVADALRTPWIAVRPFQPRHRAKWLDWSESLSLPLRAHRVFPSSIQEAWSLVTGGEGTGPIVTRVGGSPFAAPLKGVTKWIAAQNLERIAGAAEPQLSTDTVIDRVTSRAVEVVERFAVTHRPPRAGVAASDPRARRASADADAVRAASAGS